LSSPIDRRTSSILSGGVPTGTVGSPSAGTVIARVFGTAFPAASYTGRSMNEPAVQSCPNRASTASLIYDRCAPLSSTSTSLAGARSSVARALRSSGKLAIGPSAPQNEARTRPNLASLRPIAASIPACSAMGGRGRATAAGAFGNALGEEPTTARAAAKRLKFVGGRAPGEVLVPSWRHIGDTQRPSVANMSRRGANCVGDGRSMRARRQRISIRPCRIQNKHTEHPAQLQFSGAKVWI